MAAEIVSFSVDPERDKPEVLKNYVSKFNAEFTNWHVLTAYSDEQI
ncbi:SCO family protein [Paenibacillus alkalitolerans]|nr:SCO family protein [Paenibacillus alkalitolerans]